MSRIRYAGGRKDGQSGYTRVLGNEKLGILISKVQSTVISNGTELERMIIKRCNAIEDVDQFIDNTTIGHTPNGVYVCQKKVLKKAVKYAPKKSPYGKKMEPDMIVFVVEEYRVCKVIELKDGDMFDTKKSEGELQNLEWFTKEFGAKIPFATNYYICSFNQEDKQKIKEGFKGAFDIEHIMTGRELCELLKINYEEIVSERAYDTIDNFNYFVEQLLEIDEVNKKVKEILKVG